VIEGITDATQCLKFEAMFLRSISMQKCRMKMEAQHGEKVSEVKDQKLSYLMSL